jgi:hypothetical protein
LDGLADGGIDFYALGAGVGKANTCLMSLSFAGFSSLVAFLRFEANFLLASGGAEL